MTVQPFSDFNPFCQLFTNLVINNCFNSFLIAFPYYIGYGQTLKRWCNTLLISALLSKNKEVMGENNISCTLNVAKFDPSLRSWVNSKAMFYETFSEKK